MMERELNEKVEELLASRKDIYETLNELVKIVTEIGERVQNNSTMDYILQNRVNNLPYEIFDPRFKGKYVLPQIMTIEETIDEIVLKGKSIARFGDGEFGIMFGHQRWRFQKNDDKLAKRLREVVTSEDDNILIGLINFYGDLSHRAANEVDAIRAYITPDIRAQHMQLLNMDRRYADTGISRTGSLEKVKNQRRIWEDKECVFIEGNQTRMGVGNDLFDNAKSIQRILCPAESAFDKYDLILDEALKLSKDKTILIALGPTASVLAYDLAREGYHAIDIGHADMAYEWLLRNGGPKTAVTNKYNNEWPGGYVVQEIHDEIYESQIVRNLSQ